ncbi:MAG: PDZ domain-containing protein [Deltaproteobacteria bacterium]|nr:PDZ domain-containing protein [Deltaproteobacteria bacterium]
MAANFLLFSIVVLVLLWPAGAAVGQGSRPRHEAPSAAQSSPPGSTGPELSLEEAVNLTKPGVVTVIGRKIRERNVRPFPGPFGRPFFFEPPAVDRAAAGIIWDREGYILTSQLAVDGAETIAVILESGRELEAELVGADFLSGLGLLKLSEPGNYSFLTMGDPDEVKLGDDLILIGYSARMGQTVTFGKLAGRGRQLPGLGSESHLEINTRFFPGSGGGPLIDRRGRVVGINFINLPDLDVMGYAIPAPVVAQIAEQLKSKGLVDRGQLRVLTQTMTEDLAKGFGIKEAKGALVSEVVKGSMAEKAGLKPGDIIVEIDGREITSPIELERAFLYRPAGQEVTAEFYRNGQLTSLKIPVERLENRFQDLMSGPAGSAFPDLGLTFKEIPEAAARRLKLPFGSLYVDQVAADSPADEAGVMVQDIIMEVNRQGFASRNEFRRLLSESPKGDPVLLWIRRGDRNMFIQVENR